MSDVAEMKVIQSGKAKAPNKGEVALGAALAKVCLNYAIKRMEQEEKEAGKLSAIVKSIKQLPREGHAEFRAELTKELNLLKELHKVGEVTKEHTKGYAFNSFATLVTNWKTISQACEMGYNIVNDEGVQKSWSLVLAESVAMKHSHAANSAEGAQPATKRKAGRKATPLIDKAIKAAEELLENNPKEFAKFAAQVEKMLKALPKN